MILEKGTGLSEKISLRFLGPDGQVFENWLDLARTHYPPDVPVHILSRMKAPYKFGVVRLDPRVLPDDQIYELIRDFKDYLGKCHEQEWLQSESRYILPQEAKSPESYFASVNLLILENHIDDTGTRSLELAEAEAEAEIVRLLGTFNGIRGTFLKLRCECVNLKETNEHPRLEIDSDRTLSYSDEESKRDDLLSLAQNNSLLWWFANQKIKRFSELWHATRILSACYGVRHAIDLKDAINAARLSQIVGESFAWLQVRGAGRTAAIIEPEGRNKRAKLGPKNQGYIDRNAWICDQAKKYSGRLANSNIAERIAKDLEALRADQEKSGEKAEWKAISGKSIQAILKKCPA